MLRRVSVKGDDKTDKTLSGDVWGCGIAMSYIFLDYDKYDVGLEVSYFFGKLVNDRIKNVMVYQSGNQKGETYIDEYDRDYDQFGQEKLSRLSISLRCGLNL